jgi:hypothetical protein
MIPSQGIGAGSISLSACNGSRKVPDTSQNVAVEEVQLNVGE